MRSVFLVTHGEYSDYHVLCAFETEELANAYVEAIFERDVKAQVERHKRWNLERWDSSSYPTDLATVRKSKKWDRARVEEYELWDTVPVAEEED